MKNMGAGILAKPARNRGLKRGDGTKEFTGVCDWLPPVWHRSALRLPALRRRISPLSPGSLRAYDAPSDVWGPVSSQEPREVNATLAAEQAVPANGPGRGGPSIQDPGRMQKWRGFFANHHGRTRAPGGRPTLGRP